MNDERRKLLRSFDRDDFPVAWRYKKDGYTGEIRHDEDGQLGDPRDASNLGRIIHWHRRYTIASDAENIVQAFGGYEEMMPPTREGVEQWLREERGAIFILPLGMYDHSGVSFYVGSESVDAGGWDSGQVGFIFATKETCEEIGFDPSDTEAIEKCLRSEVECLDAFARGNVVFHRITDPKGDEIDACYGYLYINNEDLDELRDEVYDMVEDYASDERVERERAANLDIATA